MSISLRIIFVPSYQFQMKPFWSFPLRTASLHYVCAKESICSRYHVAMVLFYLLEVILRHQYSLLHHPLHLFSDSPLFSLQRVTSISCSLSVFQFSISSTWFFDFHQLTVNSSFTSVYISFGPLTIFFELLASTELPNLFEIRNKDLK